MTGGFPSELAPAGWYEDPERPGGAHQRRWDGTAWTDEYREAPRHSPWTPATLVGGSILGLTAVAAARFAADRMVFNTAESIGYAIGAFGMPLLLALAVRIAYVKLFAHDRPLWTDGVMIAAVVLGLLVLLGAIGREAQERQVAPGSSSAAISSARTGAGV